MPLDCPQCHTPNAEHLRTCIVCGTALPRTASAPAPAVAPQLDQDSDTFDALYAPTLMMGASQGAPDDRHADELPPPRQRPVREPVRRAPSLALLGAVAVIVVAGAWWLLAQTARGIAPSAAPASAAPVPAASTPASAIMLPGAAPQASAASPSVPAPPAASGSSSGRQTAAPTSSTSPASGPPERTDPGPTLKAAVRDRKLNTPPARASTAAAASSASEPQGTAADTPATPLLTAEPVAAPAPEPRITAQQICAARNFFLRSYCEANECGKPEHADEAHCKSLQQAAPRRPGR